MCRPMPFGVADASIWISNPAANSATSDNFDDFFVAEPIYHRMMRNVNWWCPAALRCDPKLYEHPMCKIPNWENIFVPYIVHGDAARL